MIFSHTKNVCDFIKSVDGRSIDLVRNPNTGLRFFVVPGTQIQGRVSTKVDKLSADLEVSWFQPEDAASEEEFSWMLHPKNKTNVIDSFPLPG